MTVIQRLLIKWFRADETVTEGIGWAGNLAIFRIVYLSAAVLPFTWDLVRWTMEAMPWLPAASWQPISFYQWIPTDVLRNAGLAHALAVVDLCLVGLATVGFFTRSTLGLATVLSIYVFGLPWNLGKVDHVHHLIWLMALLAAGPSGEMLSVDALIQAIRRADREQVEPEVSPSAALATLRYVWVLIGVLYFSAGIGKLRAALHHQWLGSDNLRGIIRDTWLPRHFYSPEFSLPYRVDNISPALLQTAAVGVVAFETGALGLVLFSWSRWLVVLAGLAFHWGNGLVLGIWFSSLMLAYVCMVDWARLGRFAMRTVGWEPVLVMYDGGCGLCRRTIAILKTLDICGELNPLAADPGDPRRRSHPEITDAMLVRDLYVVSEADIAGGYDAYKTIAARIPILWPMALVMRFPAVAAIGNRIYRHIADSRHCQIRGMARSSPLVGRRLLRLAPHFVGIVLLILETITFSLNSGLAFRLTTFGPEFPAHTFTRWQKEKCVWPFDQYPAFDYSATGFYQTWEPRLVYADGSESGISPEAWARSFGDGGISQFNALESVDDGNPAKRKERALTVASLLWRNLANSRRINAVAIRGYRTSFSNDPDDVRPASRILVDNFPAPLLQANSSEFQSSNADLVQRTTGFNHPP